MAEQVSRIIIKSSTGSETPASGDLYRGELGYSYKSDRLFIGNETDDSSYVIGGRAFFELFNDIVDGNGNAQHGIVYPHNVIIAGPNKDLDELDVKLLKVDGQVLTTSATTLNLFSSIDSLETNNTLPNVTHTQIATSKAIKEYVDEKTDVISDFINSTPLPGQLLVGNDQNKFEYVDVTGVIQFSSTGLTSYTPGSVTNNIIENPTIQIGLQVAELGTTIVPNLNVDTSGVLNVNRGGSGKTELNKNEILIGDYTSPIASSNNFTYDVANNVFRANAASYIKSLEIAEGLTVNGIFQLTGSFGGETFNLLEDTFTSLQGPTVIGNNTLNVSNNIVEINANSFIISNNTQTVANGEIFFNANTIFNSSPTFVDDVYFPKNIKVEKDAIIIGDLYVSGNTVTVEAQRVLVEDNILVLGANNTTDLVDLGFVGQYDGNKYAGVVRSALDDKFYVVEDYFPEPDNTLHNFDENTMLGVMRGIFEAKSINIETGTANFTQLDASTADVYNLTVVNGTANNFTIENSLFGNLTVDSVTANTLTGDILDLKYSEIRFNPWPRYRTQVLTLADEVTTVNYGDFYQMQGIFYIDDNTEYVRIGKALSIIDGSVTFYGNDARTPAFTETFTVSTNTQNTFISSYLANNEITYTGIDQIAKLNGIEIYFPNDYTVNNNIIVLNTDAVLNDIFTLDFYQIPVYGEPTVNFLANNVSTSPNTYLQVTGSANFSGDVYFESLTANNATINNLSVEVSTANNIVTNSIISVFGTTTNFVVNDSLIANSISANTYSGIYLDMIEDVNGNATVGQILTTDGLGNYYFSNTVAGYLVDLLDLQPNLAYQSNTILTAFGNGEFYFANTVSVDELISIDNTLENVTANNVIITTLVSTENTLENISANSISANSINSLEYAGIYLDMLENVNGAAANNQVLTADGLGNYFFADAATELKELTDVNSTASNNQVLTADGLGNFYFANNIQTTTFSSLVDVNTNSSADEILTSYGNGVFYFSNTLTNVQINSSDADNLIANNSTLENSKAIEEFLIEGVSTSAGKLILNCEINTHGQTIIAQPHSAGVTNILTLPAGGNQELVGTTATQTLTNKTLTSPVLNTAQINNSIADGLTSNNATINSSEINSSTINNPTINNGTANNLTLTNTTLNSNTTLNGYVTINNTLEVANDLHVDGDLFVNGNTITLDAQTLTVEDNIVVLGSNNVSDITDLGFAFKYNNGVSDEYAGLFRDATDEKFYLFKEFTIDPPVTTMTGFNSSTMLATLFGNFEANNLIASSGSLEDMIANNITMTYSTIENSVIDCGTF